MVTMEDLAAKLPFELTLGENEKFLQLNHLRKIILVDKDISSRLKEK